MLVITTSAVKEYGDQSIHMHVVIYMCVHPPDLSERLGQVNTSLVA